MKVIAPITITDAMLTSSTAPETDYAPWSAGTTYALSTPAAPVRVIRTSTHRIYESIAASNVGNVPETSPTKWLDIGPTNRWAMFDNVIGTSTTLASPLTVVLAPGAVNALALLELVGTSVTVSMTSSGESVYSRTISLEGSAPADYYEFFFAPFEQRGSVVLTDLPAYANGIVTIALTGGGAVSLGMACMGLLSELGDAQYGATAGITDYSVKSTDAFGNTTLTKRAFSKRLSFKLWLDKADVNRVFRKLAELRATPCVVIGTNDETLDILNAFGFFKDFQLEVAYPTNALCSIEFEGMK